MVDKLHDYQGPIGQLHTLRDNVKDSWQNWKDKNEHLTIPELVRKFAPPNPDDTQHYEGTSVETIKTENVPPKYHFIYREKTNFEMARLSAAVCGIEFSYAAITAFVSPILLSIGTSYELMTLSWSISPVIGFFLSPILGTLSDNCRLKYGRRRPFIILLSVLVIIGLTLIPNGKIIASLIVGDSEDDSSYSTTTIGTVSVDNSSTGIYEAENSTLESTTRDRNYGSDIASSQLQTWTIILTMIGLALADFGSDALQSPSRAYLLDLCTKDEESRGLSTFTLLAGAGGSIGYFMGSIDWENNAMGAALGGQMHAVFTIFTVIFIICIVATITTFPEIPLEELKKFEKKDIDDDKSKEDIAPTSASSTYYGVSQIGSPQHVSNLQSPPPIPPIPPIPPTTAVKSEDASYSNFGIIEGSNAMLNESTVSLNNIKRNRNAYEIIDNIGDSFASHRSLSKSTEKPHVSSKEPLINSSHEGLHSLSIEMEESRKLPSLKDYLLSIIQMPYSLKILYFTNLLCWMSHVSYSLYFTDFVGETVFEGNPKEPIGSEERDLYQKGVRFACLGMSVYSLSCLFNSFLLEFFLKRFGLKTVYTANLLIDSLSQFILFILNDKVCVIVLSWASGVLYCTIFTLPYMIIARYHTNNVFEMDKEGNPIQSKQIRGLGTDVAIIGSCVFPAQFILSMCMGKLMHLFSARVVPLCCSVVAFLAAIVSTKVMYF